MNELKKKIDEIVNETVATAYFNKEHEFLYLRPDTLANFAGLRFKEEGEEFFYAPKDKEEWKSVPRDLESLEDLIDVRTLDKGVYFKDGTKRIFIFIGKKNTAELVKRNTPSRYSTR